MSLHDELNNKKGRIKENLDVLFGFLPHGKISDVYNVITVVVKDIFSKEIPAIKNDIEQSLTQLLLQQLEAKVSTMKGDKGDAYILTPSDKQEIAQSIPVPIVEKIIEKTIVEQPVEITKVTNEIKEVAVADTPDKVIDKIHKSKKEIAISKIEGLSDILKQIKERVVRGTKQIKGGGGGAVLLYDLSPYLNGVTKTFTIPTNTHVLLVSASSFPNAFRPTTDYTYTRTSITFTSEINAGSTLGTGQSVVILYSY